MAEPLVRNRTRYLVELSARETPWRDIDRLIQRARAVANESGVRFVRAIFVPEDSTCLLLYEADSARTVADATTKADLIVERVSEVVPTEVEA